MGLVIGHTVANDDRPPQFFGGSIVPYANPDSGSVGLAWRYPIPNGTPRR